APPAVGILHRQQVTDTALTLRRVLQPEVAVGGEDTTGAVHRVGLVRGVLVAEPQRKPTPIRPLSMGEIHEGAQVIAQRAKCVSSEVCTARVERKCSPAAAKGRKPAVGIL